MQQTKSYWRLMAVAGVVSAFVASACVITTDDPDNGAGAGGSSAKGGSSTSGGSSSTAGSTATGGSTVTAGSTSTGGSGGSAVSFQCDPGEGGAQGEGLGCDVDNATDDCQVCIHDKCCPEYSACYATDPGNQCGWGGPATIDGKPNGGGELLCMHECLKAAVDMSMIEATESDIETCANNCATTASNGATKECGAVIGLQTSDVVGCIHSNCSVKCWGPNIK